MSFGRWLKTRPFQIFGNFLLLKKIEHFHSEENQEVWSSWEQRMISEILLSWVKFSLFSKFFRKTNREFRAFSSMTFSVCFSMFLLSQKKHLKNFSPLFVLPRCKICLRSLWSFLGSLSSSVWPQIYVRILAINKQIKGTGVRYW